MADSSGGNGTGTSRVLIASLAAVVVFLGFALVMMTVGRSGETSVPNPRAERINVLATSDDACVKCHRQSTPGIVEQYGVSTMAEAGVTCGQCHTVEASYPGAIEHEGGHILKTPTTAICQKCHQSQVQEFNQSRHALPAYVAMVGSDGISAEHQKIMAGIPEAQFNPDRERNALYHIEGPEITRFACHGCHDVGKPAADGSVGQCQSCHLRHEFSREQVRKPETCNACHIGPDHPQWEIYQESKHGISYATQGHDWHWDAKPGTLDVNDFPAPTCALCHMSGFGTSATTHDVGDRLTWFLFAPVSQRRPAWQDNKVRMQGVCRSCHSQAYLDRFYDDADALTEKINEWVRESDEVIAPLKEKGLVTPELFDEPIDFVHFDLWHHWGRTAKFGAWMGGADYVQWHGAYEMLREMAELREMTAEKLHEHEASSPSADEEEASVEPVAEAPTDAKTDDSVGG